MVSQVVLPRALDVQQFVEARQTEITNLEAIANEHGPAWGIEALPRHLRRRATSHNSRVHKRRPNLKLQKLRAVTKQNAKSHTEQCDDAAAAKLCNRAMRRRKARLQQDNLGRAAQGPSSGKPRMLETHVWHAKRMQMIVIWGHKLASVAPGKGHGSRAFLLTQRLGAVLHDASYWLPVELQGTATDLLSMLRLLCDPKAVDVVVARVGAHQDTFEEMLMLHQTGSFPLSAISPAKAIFQMTLDTHAALTTEAASEPGNVEPSSILLFVHAAAHDAAMQAVSSAAAQHSVTLLPRYDLQRVEFKGALSDRAVAAALSQADLPWLPGVPAAARSQASEHLFQLLQATGGATGAELPSGAVLRLRVQDPRLAAPIRALGNDWDKTQDPSSHAKKRKLLDYRQEIKQAKGLTRQLAGERLPLVWQPQDVAEPASEAAVSSYRQQQKLAGLHLADACAVTPPEAAASCPLLLSRQAPKDRNAVPSWTIIIPAGWVCPIWQALIHQGARPNCPAGQTEWHWASMQQGEPFFPHDYPETQAYARLQAELHAEQDAQRSLRPKGKYADGVPHPPAWDRVGSVMSTFADMDGAARAASPGPQLPAGGVIALSSGAAAAEAPPAPSAASSAREADRALAGPAAAGVDLKAGTRGAEQACQSSSAAEAGDAMEDDLVLVDMSIDPSLKQGEEENPLNMEVDKMQVSTSLSSAQTDKLHAESSPAETLLQGNMESRPKEPAPALEHLSSSTAEQAQQHSSQQAQLYVLRGQHHPSSNPQHRLQPAAVDEAPPQSASGTSKQQPARDVKPRCMVHVSLSTIGPGTATEGASIVALTAEEASDIRRSLVHKASIVPRQGSPGTLRDILRNLHKQQTDHQHIASSAPGQEAALEAVQEDSGAAAVAERSNANAARPLLGFVTSEAPRGLMGRGARAVCDLQLLRALRAQQKPEKPMQRVLVAYSSVLSPVLRVAEARPDFAIL